MAERLLIALVAALALIGGGYWWGHTATDNAWTARQAQADQSAREALRKETERADNATGLYLQEHLAQEDRYAALDTAYQTLRRRVPLAVPSSVCPALALPAQKQVAGAPAPPATEQSPLGDGSVVPVLTLAAVRMWNGALTGVDAPAGACGPAGAAEGADAACAEGSGLTLDDAWGNHAANARSCAADRQRFQALIEFLNHREQP